MKPEPLTEYRQPLPRWMWALALVATFSLALPLLAVFTRVDWSKWWSLITAPSSLAALKLSIITASISTIICVIFGIPLALSLSRGYSRLSRWLRALVLSPLVLPPVVSGLALLYALGKRGLVGKYLDIFGIHLGFSTVAVVLAQCFVSLPFLIITVESSLRSVGSKYDSTAACLGASATRTFFQVTLPLIKPGFIAGVVLCFARALGEFGATLTFAGSMEGVTRTLPLEIYLQRETNPENSVALAVVLVIFAFLLAFFAYRPLSSRVLR